MKNINQFNLIPSLAILGSCLAFSQGAQAKPAFHGTLTIRVEGGIMAMGGANLGEASMLMLPTTGESVEQATGDFATLKFRHGSAVTFSSTTLMPEMDMGGMGTGGMGTGGMDMGGMDMGGMEMPGTSETITFAADSGLVVTSDSVIFSSPGPHRLQIYAPVMVMDMTAPNYGMAYGELNGYFVSNKKGVVTGFFTISVPTVKW